MLKRLYLDNCFRHHDRTFDFRKGLTGIIGQNEAGKSLIVEMIRYALFGTAALRGKAEDYKKLHVELDFEVNGDDYSVVRKGTKCELTGPRMASGTKPVNEAIRAILGYGIDVFDVANACNQGGVEALSSMTPLARRQMIDKTIGLNVLDDLIAYCGSEGNAHKRTAETLKARLVEPVPPVRPEGYRPVEPTDQLEREVAEYHRLMGEINNAPKVPLAPAPCPDHITEEVVEYQRGRQSVIDANRMLETQIGRLKPETMSLAEVEAHEARVMQWGRVQARDKLLAQGHLCCPSCNHSWPIAGDALKAFNDLPEGLTAPERRDTQEARSRLGNNAEIARLQAEIQPVPEDRSADLRIWQQHSAAVTAYHSARQAYDRFHTGLAAKQQRLVELNGATERLQEVRVLNQIAMRYEDEVCRFDKDMSRFTDDKELADQSSSRSDEYLKARDILQALKISVKAHLLPSLNKVASVLLSQMTGGERGKVEVSEDFEIAIDDQAIGTLSGSGKSVANLAVRIALGQILTNRVFSVFLADEVDAAMDDDRAAYTAGALRRLTDTISQVVLVTHKRPETDHLFELRK
jgi:exonuclease SbcC